jgi:hypothetical protein
MRYNKHTLIGEPTVFLNRIQRTPAHLCGLMRYVQVDDVSSARDAIEAAGALVVSDGRNDSTFAFYVIDPRYEAIMQALKNSG